MLTLADDGGQGGNQDEHGDGHDVSGEAGGKFKVLSAEETNEKVDHGFCGAGVAHCACDDGTEDDGHADAGQRGTKAIGNSSNGRNQVVAEDRSCEHTGRKQRNDRVHIELDNQHDEDNDGNDDCEDKLGHGSTSCKTRTA